MYRSIAPSVLGTPAVIEVKKEAKRPKRAAREKAEASMQCYGNGNDCEDDDNEYSGFNLPPEGFSQEDIQNFNKDLMEHGKDIVVHRAPILIFLNVPREKLYGRFRPPIPDGWIMPVKEAGLGFSNLGKKSLGMSRIRSPPSLLGQYKPMQPRGLSDANALLDEEDRKKWPDYDPCYVYDPEDPPFVDDDNDDTLSSSSVTATVIEGQSELSVAADSGTNHESVLPTTSKNNKNYTIQKGTTPVIIAPVIGHWLREHQREGVRFLFECVCGLRPFNGQGCILADDMGLGKTLQSITLCYTLLRQGIHGEPTAKRIIIVTPTSLVKNWEKEVAKWLLGRVRCAALAEAKKEQCQKVIRCFIGGAYEILVLSYDTFRINADMFDVDGACDLLICDEAHRLKNDATQTSVALDKLRCKRRVLLSGTPLQNDLEEFFAMVNFCNPEVLGNVSHFRRYYQSPILTGREPDATPAEVKLSNERSTELSNIVNLFILRRTNTLLAQHLPPKLTQIVCVKMTNMQKDMYTRLIESKEVKSCYKEDAVSAQTLASINALKKLCNHPQLLYEKESKYVDPTKKVTAGQQILRDLSHMFFPSDESSSSGRRSGSSNSLLNSSNVEMSGKFLLVAHMLDVMRKETDERMVIVSNYTQTLDVFAMLCTERRYPFVRLDGGTSGKKRQQLVDRLNNPKDDVFIFLLSSRAGGCGLNLIGANRLILFDPDWNPATDKQAAARVWRDGQKKRCYVYRFFATGSIEEKIYQRQLSKEGLQGVVADDISMESAISSDLLRELFKLECDTVSDTHDKYHCSRCVAKKKASESMEIIELDSSRGSTSSIKSTKSSLLKSSDSTTDAATTADIPALTKPKGFSAPRKLPPKPVAVSLPPSEESSKPEEANPDNVNDPRIPKRDRPSVLPDAPQISYPQEGDLNEWAHHYGAESTDDYVLRKAVTQSGIGDLVTFVFSQKLDGPGLAAQAAAKAKLSTKPPPKPTSKKKANSENEPNNKPETPGPGCELDQTASLTLAPQKQKRKLKISSDEEDYDDFDSDDD